MMTSSVVIMPRSPWLASAAWTKKAGVPVEAKVAAILRPIWPDLPSPVTISRPLAFRIRSAAATKGVRRSDCRAAEMAAIPPASASSVRRADWTAASAESVPDESAISGFGLAMSVSREEGRGPGPLHSMAPPAMRRARRRSQRLINHNCFNSINHVILRALGAQSSICFCWSNSCREGQASKRPEQPRARLSRCFAVPCADGAIGNPSESANRHAGPVQFNAHQPGDLAGFAAAPDCRGGKRSAQQSEAAGQRQEQARAVADRKDPEIRPAGRERRGRFRLRLAQPQAPETEILSRAGEAEAAGWSWQPTAADRVEHGAAAFDSSVGIGAQNADPARHGGRGGGAAAA